MSMHGVALTLIRAGAAASAVVAGAVAAPSVHAERAQPVPLYGSYNVFLDHSQQTFNGEPRSSDPSTQAASFTTGCDGSGCVAHWLRLTDLTDNPNAPALFDYQWRSDRWESSSEYPFHCDDGGTVTTNRTDFSCQTATEASPASGLSQLAHRDAPATARARTGFRSR